MTLLRNSGRPALGHGVFGRATPTGTMRCSAACAITLADTGAVTNTNRVISKSAKPARLWVAASSMLADSMVGFNTHCAVGIEPNCERIA